MKVWSDPAVDEDRVAAARRAIGPDVELFVDAASGVVGADLHSFAVPNLYITDGSVLPTQGSANPALTIMAVAARCAQSLISANRG